MQIVIDIPEEMYKEYVSVNLGRGNGKTITYNLLNAIKNGTPLPDNFDLQGLKSDMKALNCGYPYGLDYLLNCLEKRLGITINETENSIL